MNRPLRDHAAPLPVRAAWLVAVTAGAAVLVLFAAATGSAIGTTSGSGDGNPTTSASPSAPTGGSSTATGGLAPGTLGAALQAVVPADGSDPRISGVYGSGHHGSWQFTAFLTWTTGDGPVAGGRVDLPARGASPPIDLDLAPDKLDREHQIGWTPARLQDEASRSTDPQASLALLELEIVPDGTYTLTGCSTSPDGAAHCQRQTPDSTEGPVPNELTDDPDAGPLAVRRATP